MDKDIIKLIAFCNITTYVGQIVAEISNSWCICCYIYNLGALKVDAKTSSENYKKALEAYNKGIKGLVSRYTYYSVIWWLIVASTYFTLQMNLRKLV